MRLAPPLDELFAYDNHGVLGLRFARKGGPSYELRRPIHELPEAEIVLPAPIKIAPGEDLRRLFFTQINPLLTNPLLPPLEHQYQQEWRSGSELTWAAGSLAGQFRDACAILRVVGERHGISCTSGIFMFWMMTATRDHAPRLLLEPFDVVRYGSFSKFDGPALEDLKQTLSELEPGLMARNHPRHFKYRWLRRDLNKQDLMAPYRDTSFEEVPERHVIAAQAEEMVGRNLADDKAVVEEIAALSRSIGASQLA